MTSVVHPEIVALNDLVESFTSIFVNTAFELGSHSRKYIVEQK